MKKNEKVFILLLIVVSIVIIAVLLKVRNSKPKGDFSSNLSDDMIQIEENYVEVLEDGTKLNTSDRLSEAKTFGDYEVSNIQLTEKDGKSLILADVKNVGSTKTEVTPVDITILDKDGNEIITIPGIIGDIEPGESTLLNASATTDFSNAYDFSIKVK